MNESKTPAKRKKRCDRNHIAYLLTAPNGDTYVGITHVDGTPRKSLRRRWLKHVNRALGEDRDWALCQSIRRHGPEGFATTILETIRGRAAAHTREVELIRELRPALNSTTGAKNVVDSTLD